VNQFELTKFQFISFRYATEFLRGYLWVTAHLEDLEGDGRNVRMDFTETVLRSGWIACTGRLRYC
jgi:hypothetical protein